MPWKTSSTIARGEGLLSTVIATIAALATHLALTNLAQPANLTEANWNLLVLELTTLRVEAIAVQKRPECPACK